MIRTDSFPEKCAPPVDCGDGFEQNEPRPTERDSMA